MYNNYEKEFNFLTGLSAGIIVSGCAIVTYELTLVDVICISTIAFPFVYYIENYELFR
jgi:hypothetical protein